MLLHTYCDGLSNVVREGWAQEIILVLQQLQQALKQ
jgi:hypothetical protein